MLRRLACALAGGCMFAAAAGAEVCDFMADAGSIKSRPVSWKVIFFEHFHDLPGI